MFVNCVFESRLWGIVGDTQQVGPLSAYFLLFVLRIRDARQSVYFHFVPDIRNRDNFDLDSNL